MAILSNYPKGGVIAFAFGEGVAGRNGPLRRCRKTVA
jgi:hypothetical protein